MQTKPEPVGSSVQQAGVNSIKFDYVKRPADIRAKLIKFFRLRLEAHALGVAVREYSEDRRYIEGTIKNLEQERHRAVEHVRGCVSDELLRQIARIDGDIEELGIELELISQLIDEKQSLAGPLRNLLGPIRDHLRKTLMDVFANRPSFEGTTESVLITRIATYSDARAAD